MGDAVPLRNIGLPDVQVLTLAEIAQFLRVSEQAVLEEITQQGLPARKVGGELRFYLDAVKDWLRSGPSPIEVKQPTTDKPRPGSKEAVLSTFGVLKEYGDLEEQLKLMRKYREEVGK